MYQPFSRRRGSVLPIVAASMSVVLGMAACVVDVAVGLGARTQIQAAVDAAAVSASYELAYPNNTGAVKAAAADWASRNGATVKPDDVRIWETALGQPAVTLTTTRVVPTSFARIFNVESFEVKATATAALGGLADYPGEVVPFGIPAYQENGRWWIRGTDGYEQLRTGTNPTLLQLKAAGESYNGNFQALSDNGTGAGDYSQAIANGMTGVIKRGVIVQTKTGDMVGPTRNGVEARLARPGGENILVPLIAKADWDGVDGPTQVRVVGLAAAKLLPLQNGQVFAEFRTLVLGTPGSMSYTDTPGIYAPVLIETPASGS